MIRPPSPLEHRAISTRVHRNVPRRLMASTRSQSSHRQVLEQRLGEDAGVVDEHVDPAERGQRSRRRGPDLRLVRHVGR